TAATGATDVWAVGTYLNASIFSTLTEHWDGTAWSVVPSLDGDYANRLYGVAAHQAADAWAVGNSIDAAGYTELLVEHWDGSTWSVVSSPNVGSGANRLFGIAAVAPNDVWAGGYYTDGTGHQQPLVEHWDGSQWTAVTSPSPGTTGALQAVSGAATN